MSTTDSIDESVCRRVEVLQNDAEGTVTFVATPRNEDHVPDTQWVTAGIEDIVDLTEHR